MTQPPYNGPYPGEPADPQPGQQGQPGQPQQPQPPGQWNPPPQNPQQGYPHQPRHGYPHPPGQWGGQPQQPQQPGQWNQPTQGYPQQGYPQQGYPQPQGQWGPPESLTQPTRHRGRGKLIAGTAAVIVLAGGGVATYVAFSDSSSKGGAGSPKQAVQKFVGDLNNSDFLGLLDDLAPGEKRAMADPVRDEIDQLKRLKVLQSNADPNKVTAVHLSATKLTFSDKTVSVNDHVQIVELTGGEVTVSTDATKIPLTKQFLDAAFPNGGLPTGSTGSQTINISDVVRENGKPIRVSTEKVGGKWYPSLFYTIADYAVASGNLRAPSAADRIPDKGAASGDEAVRQLITALSKQDFATAIGLASPDELGVLHDYGQLVLQAAGSGSGSAPFTVNDIQFTHKSISGGERLILKSLDVEANGQHVKVAVDKGCYTATVGSETKHLCANDLIDMVVNEFGGFGGEPPQLTSAQRTAFAHLIDGLSSVGIDVSQTGGKWYVDAVHSYFDVVGSILSGLQGDDVYELIGFFRNLD
jgi:hypothetical protein